MMMNFGRSNNGRCFIILSCFLFIVFICILLASLNEVRFESLLKFGRSAFSDHQPSSSSNSNSNYQCGDDHLPLLVNSSTSSSTINSVNNSSNDNNNMRILIGILTLPDNYERRHLLRMVYGIQTQSLLSRGGGAQIDVKFVFCNLTKDEQKVLIALEIMRYEDIIILNCTENMNKGKTYTYFSSLPQLFNNTSNENKYDYVMKANDDSYFQYFRLDKLVESLTPLTRVDLYYGYVIPCQSMDSFKHYMSGMGYLVSWDIVEWIGESDIPKKHLEGSEDRVFGDWLHQGHRGKNRYNAKWSMYNYPDPPSVCTHELWPDTIAVHLLKNRQKWIHTLNYFNVTHNLKPSKLYHIS